MKNNVYYGSMKELSQYFLPILEEGGCVNLVVSGMSMWPLFYHRRDFVVIKKSEPSEVKKGDIILFKRDNSEFVLHRIIADKGDKFIMCGDSQVKSEIIKKDSIVAKVISFSRKGKMYSIDNKKYKLYVFFWIRIRIFHRLLLELNYIRQRLKLWIKRH